MKKHFLSIGAVLSILFISLNVSAQEKDEKSTEEVLVSIEIKKSPEQLELEKREINKEKREIKEDISKSQTANGSLPGEGGQPITDEQGVLEKRHDVLTAREQVIEEKIRVYEQVAMLIEQKLKILNNKDITFGDVRTEVKKTRRMLNSLERQKSIVKGKIVLVELEIKAIEKESLAQKTLLELKKEDANRINEAIKSNEARMAHSLEEIELLNERLSFIDAQTGIAKDYLSILLEKRIEMFKTRLFTPKPYKFTYIDLVIFLVLIIGAPSVYIAKRKIRSDAPGEEKPLLERTLSNILGTTFFWGLGSGLAYFFMSFAGYRDLAVYLIPRVIFLVATITFLLFIHRVLDVIVHKITGAKEYEEKKEKPGHTFADASMTVLGWIFFVAGIFFVTEILGITPEVKGFMKIALERPFFTFGEISLSAWALLKTAFIIWLFIVVSNILDALLRNNVYQRVHLDEGVQYTFSVTIKYLMLAIGIMIGLSSLGVRLAALTVFAGTIGIGIGFGLQDIAKNFISGLVMLIERPVKVGDYIEVKDLPGRVRAIKPRSTIVDTFDNISVIVPNADFMNQQVINWSYSDKLTRLKISVGVAYGSDVELVRDSLLEVAKNHHRVLHHPEPYVWFNEFGDSSLNFNLFIWTNEPDKRFTLKSDLNFMINKIFKEKGITIPFPQRDIHFKSTDIPLK